VHLCRNHRADCQGDPVRLEARPAVVVEGEQRRTCNGDMLAPGDLQRNSLLGNATQDIFPEAAPPVAGRGQKRAYEEPPGQGIARVKLQFYASPPESPGRWMPRRLRMLNKNSTP
jgi:hypothetical protein